MNITPPSAVDSFANTDTAHRSYVRQLKKEKERIKLLLQRHCSKNNIEIPQLQSQLLRPLITFEIAKRLGISENDERLLSGALAIQIIHEASLLHDDILDNASIRHDEKTPASKQGAARALMQGDLLIAKSFELIAKTESLAAIKYYSQQNLKVINGELLQNSRVATTLGIEKYESIIALKTGALFASAASIPVFLKKTTEAKSNSEISANKNSLIALGEKIGVLYQMLDDFLDYLPLANTGKTSFQDYAQKKWTFVLSFIKDFDWHMTEEQIYCKLVFDKSSTAGKSERSPMRNALQQMQKKQIEIMGILEKEKFSSPLLATLLVCWLEEAANALTTSENASSTKATLPQGKLPQH